MAQLWDKSIQHLFTVGKLYFFIIEIL